MIANFNQSGQLLTKQEQALIERSSTAFLLAYDYQSSYVV